MNEYVLANANIITSGLPARLGFVRVRGSFIDYVGHGYPDTSKCQVYDLDGLYLAPGFIDLHVHGGGGFDTMDGTVESFMGISAARVGGGTTAFLPTTLTASIPRIERVIDACADAMGQEPPGARILGLHLEGPYFSPSQAGAQNPAYIKAPAREEYIPLIERKDTVRRVSAAPELPGGLELGAYLRSRGILASIGHTEATFDQIRQAVDSGYSLMTHLYSAMSGVKRLNGRRIAGAVEAGLYFDDLYVEVIADGVHLPSSLLRLIYKCKGKDGITLCTDAIRASGLGEGEYALGTESDGQRVLVDTEVAWMPDRQAFAGSIASTDRLLQTMVNLAGVPLSNAVSMLTENQARLLSIDRFHGSIEPGKYADMVVLDDNLKACATLVSGKVRHIGDTEICGTLRTLGYTC